MSPIPAFSSPIAWQAARAEKAEKQRDELLAAIDAAKYGAPRVTNPSVVALYDLADEIRPKGGS